MRYSVPKRVEEACWFIAFVPTALSLVAIPLKVDQPPVLLRLVICGACLVVAVPCFAVVFNDHRWAKSVLAAVGIAALCRAWARWRLPAAQSSLKAAQDALTFFRGDTPYSEEARFSEAVRIAGLRRGEPVLSYDTALAGATTTSASPSLELLASVYDEGRMQSYEPSTRIEGYLVTRALRESLEALVHSRGVKVNNLAGLLEP